jgi:hypothetical protein
MKNLLFALLLTSFSFVVAAQCTVDPNNTEFLSPRPDSLPCVERGVFYEQVLQFAIPASINLGDLIPQLPFPYTLNIVEVVIDSVIGLPNGLTYVSNPANGVLLGGQKGCALLSGTTNDPAGEYPISFAGHIHLRGFPIPGYFPGDTVIDFSALQGMGGGGGGFGPGQLSLTVIEQGAECREASSSVKDFSASLQNALSVYPNPNEGIFHVALNTEKNMEVEIAVVDITGRKVFGNQYFSYGFFKTSVDLSGLPKGLYAVQLKTADGFAVKNILVH